MSAIPTHPPYCMKGWFKGVGEVVVLRVAQSSNRPRVKRRGRKGGKGECQPLLLTHTLVMFNNDERAVLACDQIL